MPGLPAPRMRRDLAFVALTAFAAALIFSRKAFHIDEPLFLAPAEWILSHPRQPLAFDFNWYGLSEPMAKINNTPLPALYALALGLWATGGAEQPMRLFFLPWDLAAAVALYLLAARFLARPLLPVLLILLSPGYLIGLGLLYPDKMAAALGFSGLYALTRALDTPARRSAWLTASAAILGAATLFKYSAVLFLIPAWAYAIHRGLSPRATLNYALGAILPLSLYFIADAAEGARTLNALWLTTAWGAGSWWSGVNHKLRSLLAFIGGLGAAASLGPFLPDSRRPWPLISRLLCAAAAILLFSPIYDKAPVRGLDRWTGILFSTMALAALSALCAPAARRLKGWWLWMPWALSAMLLNCVYWSVTSRLVVLIVIPVILCLAEALENAWEPASLRVIQTVGLTVTAALTLALAMVDYRHASSSKEIAEELSRSLPKQGKVYFAGHWGFQYYMERLGAAALDASRGGWSEPRPADVIVLSSVNSNLEPPGNFSASKKRIIIMDSPIPLRLMSGWFGQGGFYSSALGFLPYAFSREPVDAYSILEL